MVQKGYEANRGRRLSGQAVHTESLGQHLHSQGPLPMASARAAPTCQDLTTAPAMRTSHLPLPDTANSSNVAES